MDRAISMLADPSIFATSCALIMWAWIYVGCIFLLHAVSGLKTKLVKQIKELQLVMTSSADIN
jgi:hypothetical protein